MGFSVSNFVKSAAKTVEQRILGSVISNVTSGLPLNLESSALSTAQSLFNAGASFESISSLTSQRTDSIIGSGSSVYYALAGRDPARVSSADLVRLRSIGSDTSNFHVNNINPTTAINAKRKKEAEIIMSAIS